MPTRIISDKLLTSKKVNQLNPAEFEVYIRILLCVDDFGFYSADPVEVARAAYPKRDVLSKKIEPLLNRLIEIGLIVTYEVNGEPYLMVTNFINSPRAGCAKYPAPDGHLITKSEWKSGICIQIISELHDLQADACNLHAPACNLLQKVGLTVKDSRTETVTVTVTDNRNRSKEKWNMSGFIKFWDAYPRKVSKADAEKAFGKLDFENPTTEVLLKSIEEWKKSAQWQEEDGKFIPYPATWLNKRLWESEVKPGISNKQNFEGVTYTDEQMKDFEADPEEYLKKLQERADV